MIAKNLLNQADNLLKELDTLHRDVSTQRLYWEGTPRELAKLLGFGEAPDIFCNRILIEMQSVSDGRVIGGVRSTTWRIWLPHTEHDYQGQDPF